MLKKEGLKYSPAGCVTLTVRIILEGLRTGVGNYGLFAVCGLKLPEFQVAQGFWELKSEDHKGA